MSEKPTITLYSSDLFVCRNEKLCLPRGTNGILSTVQGNIVSKD